MIDSTSTGRQAHRKVNPFCTSSYLALRYVARDGEAWIDGVEPKLPISSEATLTTVNTPDEIGEALADLVAHDATEAPALFLSGGIDSAILAAFVPKHTRAYHIRFAADGAVDESAAAQQYAWQLGLQLTVVQVTWEDVRESMPRLMRAKRAPLHPIEGALYKAAVQAQIDGCDRVLVGNGADSTFGGMDKLLSRHWSFEEFYRRYTYTEPSAVLQESVDMRDVYEPYRRGTGIDYIGFLKHTHGIGIVQSFENAIGTAGLRVYAPYERLALNGELDLARVRSGQPKYLLFELFRKLYPSLSPPEKIPFARPTDTWMKEYAGPRSAVFKRDLPMADFSGEQRFQIYCLDAFVEMLSRWR